MLLYLHSVDCVCSFDPSPFPPHRSPGVKTDDYWEVGKAHLQDPTQFFESLFKYDWVSARQEQGVFSD